jgi:hypothetical protein
MDPPHLGTKKEGFWECQNRDCEKIWGMKQLVTVSSPSLL